MSVSSTPADPPVRCVPRRNRSFLADPSLEEVARLVDGPNRPLTDSEVQLGGRSLEALRRWTAEDTFAGATEYAHQLGRGLSTPPGDGPIIVAGHQPTLFHCGVFLKNIAISRLARRVGGVALNLIVDNDLATSWQLRLPSGDRANPTFSHIPFTNRRVAGPWEDLDCELSPEFTGFADRVCKTMSTWRIDPVLPDIWPAAIETARRGAGLADCLSAPRMALQDDLGAGTLELPISRLAARTPFQWYVALLLGHAERFAVEHNRALALYRRLNRVRSRTHPAPDLARRDDWLETPFWCWRTGDTRRRRLLVQSLPTGVVISDGTGPLLKLPPSISDDPESSVALLEQLQHEGLRIRPSALSTTLFARVFLADLFVHGIGGSKYDEVTDVLMEGFFGITPPTFLTLSGTLHLPLAEPYHVTNDDLASLQSRSRRFQYNSQDFLPPDCHTDLQDRKCQLITEQQQDPQPLTPESRQQRRARYRAFQSVNRELREHTLDSRRDHEQKHRDIQRQLEANVVLANREFSFCLFSKDSLRSFFDLSLAGLE